MPFRSLLVAVAAFAVVAASCGQSGDVEGTANSLVPGAGSTAVEDDSTVASNEATTSSSADTTTITEPTGPVSPLNGMPVDDPTLSDRKLIAVKIDNSTNAQPQSGIEDADAMIELLVESGWTRFIALFLESDTEWLGPMRSLRPTDSTVIAPLNGVIQVSGGQPWVQRKVRGDDVPLIGEVGSPVTMRWNGRNAPHNLYVNTAEVRAYAEGRGLDQTPPPPLFEWGELHSSAQPAVGNIFFDWTSRIDITWQWTGTEYIRFVGDKPHEWRTMDGDIVQQVAADSLVVLKVDQYTACPSGAGSCVPASDTVGDNEALVFADGQYVRGTWERDSINEWFTLTTASGDIITVPPGRIFIMLYPDTADITW